MFRFPYLSIDLETTGLDRQKSHILQIAAVYDNGKSLNELPTFNKVIKWPVIHHAEEYAMNLNKDLLERAFKNNNIVSIDQARSEWVLWLDKIQSGGRFTPAGKNIQAFDIPILENKVNAFSLRRFLIRALDPGSMYSNDFTHVPNLDEINNITGREAVSHDALEDAWDVVHAIRYKWEVND